MIRYVDLSSFYWTDDSHPNGLKIPFAFIDTITNQFVEIDGQQTWDSVEELRECLEADSQGAMRPASRFLNLVPDDVPKTWADIGIK